ncbi:MAG: ribose-phosphate pyrophosphokinase [Alphaproteobacteria bacterium]|nr:ribose-phosphate pyrophosphokinase [Alphaproteobacteria bacterium]
MINILSSNKYEYLKKNLLQSGRFNDIDIETKVFPDGERYFRISNYELISGNPAVYICGTVDDEAILEAYHICSTLVRLGCSSLHLVIPYFGYSTMERAVKPGEIVSAKNIAHLFSSIALSAMGNYIYMVDLHSLGTQYYFEQNIHPIHLTTEKIIDRIIADIRTQTGDVVLASADMGRAKWIEKMSNRLGIDGAYIMKKRISGDKTVVEALNADVKGRDVIIFDDMIRSGSSIVNAALAYKSIGARDVYVVCVHGVFVKGALEKLQDSHVIKRVICTDTHCGTMSLNNDFVKVYDMSEIILEGLKI